MTVAKCCGRTLKTFALALFMMTVAGMAQSLTTGALAGTVTDPSGASIPGAKVTATSITTGAVHSTQSQGNGSYLIPLLEPGQYAITVEKTGFTTAKQAGVGVSTSATNSLNFKLQVGAAATTVEVTGEAPLLQPQNANTTTTLDTKAIENLPNPGGDITMLAQIAPGASMHVQGGGGTAGLSFNGVQGNAVEYTQDGMDVNDPFNNDNNSGASNMLLGQNGVQEVSVNTSSYSVDQGRMSAGQVNYISKPGGNNFHGDLQYQWNGRVLNAYDFFTKSTPVALGGPVPAKPFDNVNNWAAGIGGHIIKNKLFFFVDSEGTRIDLPNVINFTVPTPAFEAYAKQQLALGGYDTTSSLKQGSQFRFLPAETGANAPVGIDESAWQNHIIGLYGNTAPGTRNGSQITQGTARKFGCNLDPQFVTAQNPLGVDPSYNPQVNPTSSSGSNPSPSDTGCVNTGIFTGAASTPEELTSVRLDYNLNQNNTLWGKFLDDRGLQTTGINAVNPIFNEDSNQPQRQGVLDYTHVFTPTLTNDASTGFLWYSAIFNFNTPAAEHAALDGIGQVATPFTGFGSRSFPQGRNVTQYQFIDNLTWTHGNHSFKVGENFRRELVNDHHFAETFASSSVGDFAEFEYAAANSANQNFARTSVEQFKSFSTDLYAGDVWQIRHDLTLTYGIRATHNSNPVDRAPLEGIYQDFTTFAHPNVNNGGNLATPPNSIFTARTALWNSVPFAVWQPRASLAWQPHANTLVKAGFGMFSQVAATSGAETLARNPPFNPTFSAGFARGNLGANGSAAGCTQAGGSNPQCGFLWDPTLPGSAVSAVAAGNAQFQANFTGGASSCALPGVNKLNCVPQAAINAFPLSGLKPPMVYNYSLSVQQQLGRSTAVSVGYVGTRSQHNPYTVDDNGYQVACAGCFAPFQFSPNGSLGAPDARFFGYSQTRYDGYGRYDSMQAAFNQRLFHGLTINLNYTWSHCLDAGSSGRATPYLDGSGLSNFYYDCQHDITHVANANYTYQLPVHASGFVGKLVNSWQVSGATFSQGGEPLFIEDNGGSSMGGLLQQSTGPRAGFVVKGVNPYAKNVYIGNVATGTNNCIAGQNAGPQGCFNVTQPGQVQWLNPLAIESVVDGNTGTCYNPSTNSEQNDAASCQFFGNNGTTLRGPGFQWTNFDVSKTVQVSEKIGLRLDFQAYNLFNHPNFANPDSDTAGNNQVFGNTFAGGRNILDASGASLDPTISGSGAIRQMASPNNGLLGQNGGDSAPRMIAFQAKIVF